MKQVATIHVNGEPFLSYRPDTNRIMSPATVPWSVINALGAQLLGSEASDKIAPLSYHMPFGCETVESPEDKVFVTTARGLSLSRGTVVERKLNDRGEVISNHVKHSADDPKVVFDWVGVNDYRDVP